MTLRVALYARFSSSQQNPLSIDDQLRQVRALAATRGASVAAEFADAAISGQTMAERPGLEALLAAARAGGFDLVLGEGLDRFTRDGGHAWEIWYALEACGVALETIAEGPVDELKVGFKGTMNAVFLKDLRIKVRRGLEGVIRAGRHSAGVPFGYRRKLVHDAATGERIRGLIEIDPPAADVVRRIASDYLAGATARMIAHALNAEGVAGPRGRGWTADAILGREGQGRGVLRNPIYAGELVWNRQTRRKNRSTGAVTTRANPPELIVRHPAPELRILDPETWAAVQARLAERSALVARAGNPSAANAPRRLLAGLVRCGACGGPMHTGGAQHRYRCTARFNKGADPAAGGCANARTAKAADVEAQVLEVLRRDLLHPEVIEAFVQEYRAQAAKRAGGAHDRRRALERELAESTRRAARLVDQVAEGHLQGRAVAAKLAELEGRGAQLEAQLAAEARAADVVALHPHAGQRYRQLVAALQDKLAGADAAPTSPELAAARQALRQVVVAVRILPGPARGEWSLEIQDDLTRALGLPGLLQPAAATA